MPNEVEVALMEISKIQIEMMMAANEEWSIAPKLGAQTASSRMENNTRYQTEKLHSKMCYCTPTSYSRSILFYPVDYAIVYPMSNCSVVDRQRLLPIQDSSVLQMFDDRAVGQMIQLFLRQSY